MSQFKASAHRFQNFMHRKNYKCLKPRGELGFLDRNTIAAHDVQFKKCVTPLRKKFAMRMKYEYYNVTSQ